MRWKLNLVLFCALVVTVGHSEAEAIPAFARAYQVPCATCHISITRRNEFGDAFRRAGYRWPGDPSRDIEAQSISPVAMKGIGAVVGQLAATTPIGLTMTSSLSTVRNNKEIADPTVGSPAFTILFGGALGEHASVFGTWGGQGAPNELYAQFGNIGNRKEINLKVGRFEPTTTLFKNNEATIGKFKLTASAINGHAVGQGRVGFETNGLLGQRTFYALGMVQNAGSTSNYDKYYNVAHKFGGMAFDGSEPEIDFDAEPSALEDLTVTLAHWGYLGRVDGPSGEELTDILRFGLDGKVGFRKWALWSGLMYGADHDIVRDLPSVSVTGFTEVSYLLKSWLIPTYLYQYQDTATFQTVSHEHSLGLVTLIQENIRVSSTLTWAKQEV